MAATEVLRMAQKESHEQLTVKVDEVSKGVEHDVQELRDAWDDFRTEASMRWRAHEAQATRQIQRQLKILKEQAITKEER
eukprot:35138-Eustigmatos_ZCMA.PRE.1